MEWKNSYELQTNWSLEWARLGLCYRYRIRRKCLRHRFQRGYFYGLRVSQWLLEFLEISITIFFCFLSLRRYHSANTDINSHFLSVFVMFSGHSLYLLFLLRNHRNSIFDFLVGHSKIRLSCTLFSLNVCLKHHFKIKNLRDSIEWYTHYYFYLFLEIILNN